MATETKKATEKTVVYSVFEAGFYVGELTLTAEQVRKMTATTAFVLKPVAGGR